ncbi:MAG: class GN sortase [Gammaproteobacteria bacterium]|nr:class GN sortase [Gammaproteobacteria bacterium]
MWLRYLTICSLCAALTQLLPGAWILAKAELAQVLIARAWSAEGAAKPWPWADTWPVLRLQAPHLGVDLYVLEGGQGNALAFGPGRMPQVGDQPPAGSQPPALLIAGHRDTHFRFLQELRAGDSLRLRAKQGGWQRWRVDSVAIVDSRHQALKPVAAGLLLVTCYPFEALRAGGPLRYVVTALPH